MKCGVITIAIYIIIDLIVNCVKSYYIANNEYFDEPWDLYFLVFALCLLPQFIALMLVSLYLCQPDSEDSRRRLPLAVILAFATSVAVAIWITIYICLIYDSEDGMVWTGTGEKAKEDEEETNYEKMPRGKYLALMLFLPIINITFYFVSWLQTKDWVRRNEGYRLSN